MNPHFKGTKSLASLLEQYKGVKIRKAVTLFPPTLDMSNLREGKCPACNRKLKILRTRPLAICNRKTCPLVQDKDSFRISLSKLARIK